MDDLSSKVKDLLSSNGTATSKTSSISNKTIIVLVVVGIVFLAIVGIGIGIGIYFYRKNKKPKAPSQVFGILFPPTAFVNNAADKDDLKIKVDPLIESVKTTYKVSSLATLDQLTTAVEKFGLTTCFLGMVDNDFENLYIAPYLTSEDQIKNNACYASKDNVKVHKANKLPITFNYGASSNAPPVQGYFVSAPDGTDPPTNGSTVTIGGYTCTIVANFA